MSAATETRARFLSAIAERVPAHAVAEVHVFQPMKQGGVESGVAVVAANERLEGNGAVERLAVYTATYRLTIKGPDRGKWDFSITAEADAPLVTVDAVVRGVQRRSGDAEEPARLTGEEFRSALPPAEESPQATPSTS